MLTKSTWLLSLLKFQMKHTSTSWWQPSWLWTQWCTTIMSSDTIFRVFQTSFQMLSPYCCSSTVWACHCLSFPWSATASDIDWYRMTHLTRDLSCSMRTLRSTISTRCNLGLSWNWGGCWWCLSFLVCIFCLTSSQDYKQVYPCSTFVTSPRSSHTRVHLTTKLNFSMKLRCSLFAHLASASLLLIQTVEWSRTSRTLLSMLCSPLLLAHSWSIAQSWFSTWSRMFSIQSEREWFKAKNTLRSWWETKIYPTSPKSTPKSCNILKRGS